MKEREYKGWEIIKLLEEGKLKDGTKISVIKKETKEKYVYGYVVYGNKIYHSPMVYSITPVAIEKFASNNIFKIEKKIEYMTLQEAVATKEPEPLRLNEEWSKKLPKLDDVNKNNESEEYKLLEAYQNGRYLYIQDMFIVLGWFFSGKDLKELISSNEKVWCVEGDF